MLPKSTYPASQWADFSKDLYGDPSTNNRSESHNNQFRKLLDQMNIINGGVSALIRAIINMLCADNGLIVRVEQGDESIVRKTQPNRSTDIPPAKNGDGTPKLKKQRIRPCVRDNLVPLRTLKRRKRTFPGTAAIKAKIAAAFRLAQAKTDNVPGVQQPPQLSAADATSTVAADIDNRTTNEAPVQPLVLEASNNKDTTQQSTVAKLSSSKRFNVQQLPAKRKQTLTPAFSDYVAQQSSSQSHSQSPNESSPQQ